jgi:hypothetical protein
MKFLVLFIFTFEHIKKSLCVHQKTDALRIVVDKNAQSYLMIERMSVSGCVLRKIKELDDECGKILKEWDSMFCSKYYFLQEEM